MSTAMVSIHHVDGNPANNEPPNLMTLCGSCHTRWHWQHGRRARPRAHLNCSACGASARPWEHMKRGMCSLHYQRQRAIEKREARGVAGPPVPVSRKRRGSLPDP
jgi:hypothetical protein